MRKSYECHEADPHFWEGIRESGLVLLSKRELRRYRDLIPDNEDLQDARHAAVYDPEKYVSLFIGQKDDEEQRAESDEENYHGTNNAEIFSCVLSGEGSSAIYRSEACRS